MISFAAHAAFFSGIVWLQDFTFLSPQPKVVRVDLVSFAPGPQVKQTAPEIPPAIIEKTPLPPTSAAEKSSQLPDPPPAEVATVTPKVNPSPEQLSLLKPDISLKKKPKNLKKIIAERKVNVEKTVKKVIPKPQKNPEKTLEQARQKIARKLEAQRKKQIDQALVRMQKAVAEKRPGQKKGPGVGSGQGDRMATLKELYKMQIGYALRQNWIYNDILAGMNPNLEARVFIKILKSGEIRDISYETRSGNAYLDESVKKAIQRSNPMPELPKGMNTYELVLIFNPRGIK